MAQTVTVSFHVTDGTRRKVGAKTLLWDRTASWDVKSLKWRSNKNSRNPVKGAR